MNELECLYEKERTRLAQVIEDPTAPQGDYMHPVFGKGKIDAALMIIGEAPGKEEASCGTPFVGKAGRQLDECLEFAGIDRNTVFVTNAVKYRPVNRKEKTVSNRTPSSKEVLHSLYVLENEIVLIKPKIIATFGNTPLNALRQIVGEQLPAGTVGELHGQAIDCVIEDFHTVLFPMYHPASVIYNRALKTTLEEDALSLAKLTLTID